MKYIVSIKNVFPKIIAIISEQRQAGAAVGSFVLDILSNNSRKIVSRPTLYSGYLLLRFFFTEDSLLGLS